MQDPTWYLILANRNPEHFHELVDALTSAESSVVVHVDAKSSLAQFARSDIFAVRDRVDVQWGGWSIVEATLRALREADLASAEHVSLISGDSYPLQPPERIAAYLRATPNTEFINSVPLPCPEMEKPLSRLTRLYVEYDPRDGRTHLAARVVNRAHLPHLGLRRALAGRPPRTGSQWWTLSGDFCRWLARESVTDRLTRFCRRSFVPDEMYVQTMLAGSPFAHHEVRRALMFSDWSDPTQRPALMNERHILAFRDDGIWQQDDLRGQGPALFARKFGLDGGSAAARVRQELWPVDLLATSAT